MIRPALTFLMRLLLLTTVSVAACSPTLDWRETAAEGSGIVALFPCRPHRHERRVNLAGVQVQMEMLVCETGGATYALSFFDVDGPAAVTPALTALREVARANLAAAESLTLPLRLTGMTPNPRAALLVLRGARPGGGGALRQHAAFFAKGLRVYQASVIGTAPAADAVETFLAGLKFPT